MDFHIIFQEPEMESGSLHRLRQQQQPLQDEHQQRQQLLTPDHNVTGSTSSGFQLPDPYSQPFYGQQGLQIQQTSAAPDNQSGSQFSGYAYYPTDGDERNVNLIHSSGLTYQQPASSCDAEYPTFTELMPAPSLQRGLPVGQSML